MLGGDLWRSLHTPLVRIKPPLRCSGSVLCFWTLQPPFDAEVAADAYSPPSVFLKLMTNLHFPFGFAALSFLSNRIGGCF